MPTIMDIHRIVDAAISSGPGFWDTRVNAYYKAYRRRYKRERDSVGTFGPASAALICVASRMAEAAA